MEIVPWAIACGALFSIPTSVAIYRAGDPNENYRKVLAMTVAASTLGAFCLGMLATMLERVFVGDVGPELSLIQAGMAASIAIPLSLITLVGMEHWERIRSKTAGSKFIPKYRRQRK